MVTAAKLTRVSHKSSHTTALSGRQLYHLQFSLQVASPEILDTPYTHTHAHTSVYMFVYFRNLLWYISL